MTNVRDILKMLDRQEQLTKCIHDAERMMNPAADLARQYEAASKYLLSSDYGEALTSYRTTLDYLDSLNSRFSAYDVIAKANREFAAQLERQRQAEKLTTSSLALVEPSWTSALNVYTEGRSHVEAMQLALSQHTSLSAGYSIAAQARVAGLDGSTLGLLAGFDAATRAAAGQRFADLTDSYRRLNRWVDRSSSQLWEIPKFVTEYPPRELFASATMLAAISPRTADDREQESEEEQEDALFSGIDATLPELLANVDPLLPGLLAGARQALASSNPDRVRHASASIREMYFHLLRSLAPDDAVAGWTFDASDFDQNGRPTRLARCRYITRNLRDAAPDFGRFLEADFSDAGHLVKQLHKGTHKLESFTQHQAAVLLVRTEGLARTLIIASRANGEDN